MGDHEGGGLASSSTGLVGGQGGMHIGVDCGEKESSHLASISAFMVGEGIFN